MPFLTPNVPAVDPAEFLTRPRQERIRFLGTFWAEYLPSTIEEPALGPEPSAGINVIAPCSTILPS